VQLLILGIIGEYLGRLYLTANRKPQSVVRSVMRADPLSGDSPVGWESRNARELQPRLPERA